MSEFIAVSVALLLMSALGHLEMSVAVTGIAAWGVAALVTSIVGKALSHQ